MTAVVVVGSVNMDLTAVVSRMPRPGETILGSRFHMAPGGKGSNQAVASRRAGAASALVGCLGDDPFGRELLEFCRREGLDTSRLLVLPGADSGIAQITVTTAGENAIVVVPGANGQLNSERVEAAADLLSGAAVVLCQLEVPLAAVAVALRLGRLGGARTILNPAPALQLSDELLGMVDLLVPNEHEAAQLTGIPVAGTGSALSACGDLRRRGCRAVAMTLGARGAVYEDGERRLMVPAFPVRVVDSVAAGDAFCGTLSAAVANGLPIETCLLRASAAGALATTVRGAAPSLPTFDLVDGLLGGNPQLVCAPA